jgi:hypothetical protein
MAVQTKARSKKIRLIDSIQILEESQITRKVKTMGVKWVPDTIQEQVMHKRFGLEYRWGAVVQMAQIDLEKSKLNNVRPSQAHGFDEEQVLRLSVLMEDNADFYAVVLWQPSRSDKFQVVHGVHRVAAAELVGETEIMAYIITGPDKPGLAQLVDFYARAANTYALSKQPDAEDAWLLAKWFMKHGKSAREAAKLVGLSEKTVQVFSRRDRVETEMREDGYDTRHLTPTHLTALSAIKMMPVRKKMADFIIKAGISGNNMYEYTKKVQSKQSQAEQLEVIDKLASAFKKIKRPAASAMLEVRVRTQFQNAIMRVVNLMNTKVQVRQLFNCLDSEMFRVARDVGNKLLALGDTKHAESTRLEQIVGKEDETNSSGDSKELAS